MCTEAIRNCKVHTALVCTIGLHTALVCTLHWSAPLVCIPPKCRVYMVLAVMPPLHLYPFLFFACICVCASASVPATSIVPAWVPLNIAQALCCWQEDAAACKQAMLNCNIALLTPVTDTGVNVYDLRKKCLRPPGHCYHTANIGTYLNSHRVKTTLKVKQAWTECNSAAHQNLMGDWLKNYERHIPTMLKNGHTALIYAGDADYMCNWLGNQKWTQAMKWHGQKGYLKAPDLTWKVNGEVRGTVRHSDGLTFVRIHDAGHMVPRDAPGASLAMLQQYLAHQTLIVEA